MSELAAHFRRGRTKGLAAVLSNSILTFPTDGSYCYKCKENQNCSYEIQSQMDSDVTEMVVGREVPDRVQPRVLCHLQHKCIPWRIIPGSFTRV